MTRIIRPKRNRPKCGCWPNGGVLWPVNYMMLPGERRQVQRCDECNIFESDDDAGWSLLQHLTKSGVAHQLTIEPEKNDDGSYSTRVYVDPVALTDDEKDEFAPAGDVGNGVTDKSQGLHETPMDAPPPVGTLKVTDGRWPVLEVVVATDVSGSLGLPRVFTRSILVNTPIKARLAEEWVVGTYRGLTPDGTHALVSFADQPIGTPAFPVGITDLALLSGSAKDEEAT